MAGREPPGVAPRRCPAAGAAVLVVSGRLAAADVAALCERARALLEAGGAGVVVVDTGGLVDCDLGAVEVLARLGLTARRLGLPVRLRAASPQLRALLALAGLADVLRPEPPG